MEKIIEKLTTLVAALTALIIALSASHELGYFTFIGGAFFQSFASVSDYFSNALLWAPFAALTAAGWLNYDWIWKATPRPRKGDWPSWIVPALIILIPALSFFFLKEGPPTFYFMLFLYGWLLYSEKFIKGHDNTEPFFKELLKLARIAVPICAGLYTLGYTNAKSDLTTIDGAYIMELRGQDKPVLRIPLRSFDKGVLVRDPIENRIIFINWSDVRSISKLIANRDQSLGCKWFNILCSPRIISP
ncbi:MAG: hypothetical protein JSR61_01015 [Proteobacteria bacterium]|nr:hypothetical protein [Pseudomonadota bacterium]